MVDFLLYDDIFIFVKYNIMDIILNYVEGDYIRPIINDNLGKINWEVLSMNPSAIHFNKGKSDLSDFIEKNLKQRKNYPVHKNTWEFLNLNTSTVHINKGKSDKSDFLEKNFHKIDWYYLSRNPSAVYIRKKFR